jgi:peptidoglycan LD-endopeptidase LytH
LSGLTGRTRIKIVSIAVVVIAGIGALLWVRNRPTGTPVGITTGSPTTQLASPSPTISPTPTPSPSPSVSPSPEPLAPQSDPGLTEQPKPDATSPPSNSFVGTLNLIIPVAGVRPDQLLDTFTAARSEGRSHDAIDIMAAAGTPVLAAIDGEIVKLFQSERGGTTIYQLSPDKKLVFYYAHLQRYADRLAAGKYVRQGEVIGYVGDTGNAGAGNYHLHFSIAVLSDPKRYWEGTNINPFPLLKH